MLIEHWEISRFEDILIEWFNKDEFVIELCCEEDRTWFDLGCFEELGRVGIREPSVNCLDIIGDDEIVEDLCCTTSDIEEAVLDNVLCDRNVVVNKVDEEINE